MPLAPISANVPRYCFDNDMYWYIIEAQMEDGRWWELSRYYADFYDFQIALLEAFPEEAGMRGRPRTLPFMPGPVAHVTDAISNGRRQNLDEYIKQIVVMPPHISRSMLVRNLFKPKPGQDYEIDPNALNDDYRLSGQSLQQVQSRQSTGPGNQSAYSGYGGMPPPPQGSARSGHRAQGSYGGGPNGGPNGAPQLPPLHNQASTLTQGSTGTSASARGAPAASGPLKIKVHYQDDIVALRVPQDTSFAGLREKTIERLKAGNNIRIQYKDEMTGSLRDLRNDNDLNTAVQRNPKLQLHVS